MFTNFSLKLNMPINFGGTYWVAAEVSFAKRQITIFDPQTKLIVNEQMIQWISYLRELLPWMLIASSGFHRERLTLRVSTDPYDVVRLTVGVPQQRPGSGDCGVFVLKIIEYLCTGSPFNFGPHDGPILRLKIVVSMLMIKLSNRSA